MKAKSKYLVLSHIWISSILRDLIGQAQEEDVELKRDFSKTSDGVIFFRDQVLGEAHKSRYSVHPGYTKMYCDLKQLYWWPGMKTYITNFVSQCLTCQKVKIEHQMTSNQLQPLNIPEWKWESISKNFVMGLPRSQNGHDSNYKMEMIFSFYSC